jgi:hypothetical protein
MTEPDTTATGRPELLELYRVAVDEYRFQALFNWSRTQYWLVFNTGILAAGVAVRGIAGAPGWAAAIVLLVGAVAACLSMRAVLVTHDYYRAARNHMKRLEKALALPGDVQLDTTQQMRDGRTRSVNVTAVSYLLLAVVAVADVVAAVASLLVPA